MKILKTGLILLLCCGAPLAPAADRGYPEVDWEQLIPAKVLDTIKNAPIADSPVNSPAEGSEADQLRSPLDNMTPSPNPDDPFEKAIRSAEVVDSYDGRKIRIPGFVVPLEFNEQRQVISFFLVPYFGACIHLPPPPPNQIIHVQYPEGLAQDSLQTPYWLDGEIHIDQQQNGYTRSAYSMQVERISLFDE